MVLSANSDFHWNRPPPGSRVAEPVPWRTAAMKIPVVGSGPGGYAA